MCKQLKELKIEYYRHPMSNIITIKSKYLNEEITSAYGLVPDNHDTPNWFKIVIMEHVTIEKLALLIEQISKFHTTD